MTTAFVFARGRRRHGITLTEILIAILILGVGLASVATLFPLGLIRLRDAARYSRSAYLAQAATGDIISRSLLSSSSFTLTPYYFTTNSFYYDPFIQDTPAYGSDWATDAAGPGAYAGLGGLGLPSSSVARASGNNAYGSLNGPGLPFAYDPLWRYQTINPNNPQANGASPTPPGGYYPADHNSFEARFGSGIGFIRDDPQGGLPSAHGLQRLTNFTPAMLVSTSIPSIFVSPEDVVWQEPNDQSYLVGVPVTKGNPSPVGSAPSPVLPDLSISYVLDPNTNAKINTFQLTNDFHYSWIFTGQLINSSNQAFFDGNIVIFENRPFAITSVTAPNGGATVGLIDGETVVEAIFGHSNNLNAGGYSSGADRTVLLRWYATQLDPVVKTGDWIADVTYERHQNLVYNPVAGTGRFLNGTPPFGVPNPSNNGEWDNLPAQRCFWYQVQKVQPAGPDPYIDAALYRSMVVTVNQSLQSRTLLTAVGKPVVINAALIAPNVVNVIPQTIFTR
jgi:Prokaryotic N-terminal methylation motif